MGGAQNRTPGLLEHITNDGCWFVERRGRNKWLGKIPRGYRNDSAVRPSTAARQADGRNLKELKQHANGNQKHDSMTRLQPGKRIFIRFISSPRLEHAQDRNEKKE
jgi:hypothetical protein